MTTEIKGPTFAERQSAVMSELAERDGNGEPAWRMRATLRELTAVWEGAAGPESRRVFDRVERRLRVGALFGFLVIASAALLGFLQLGELADLRWLALAGGGTSIVLGVTG